MHERPVMKRLLKQMDIDHELDVFDARRDLMENALQLGFSRDRGHYLVTALTELANNIVVHSVGGWIAIEQVWSTTLDGRGMPVRGMTLTASDRGPGIADIELALQDGFSTANSLGCGLSGVKRLMDELAISSSSRGTHITATMWTSEIE